MSDDDLRRERNDSRRGMIVCLLVVIASTGMLLDPSSLWPLNLVSVVVGLFGIGYIASGNRDRSGHWW